MTAGHPPTVGIVGTGVIGASIGLALRKEGWRVLGYDASRRSAQAGLAMGAMDVRCGSPEAVAKAADIVILAVPPDATVPTAQALLAAGARAVTDVTSVKGDIVRELGAVPAFLGGHPMAGSEQRGPGAARADIFVGATWVLTPTSATDLRALDLGRAVARAAGAVPEVMDAEAHDRMVAVSSHAPHAVAVALVLAFADHPEASAVSKVLGSGWRSSTRIASGNPEMWTGIFKSNDMNTVVALRSIREAISFIEDIIEKGDFTALHTMLSRAAAERTALEPRQQDARLKAV